MESEAVRRLWEGKDKIVRKAAARYEKDTVAAVFHL